MGEKRILSLTTAARVVKNSATATFLAVLRKRSDLGHFPSNLSNRFQRLC